MQFKSGKHDRTQIGLEYSEQNKAKRFARRCFPEMIFFRVPKFKIQALTSAKV